jgi:fatty-acid desaturase
VGRSRAHFLLHDATFSINSLCHCFGRRPFGTTDESRNLAWLAPLAFGEAWHNRPAAMPGTRDDDGMPSGRSGREREW